MIAVDNYATFPYLMFQRKHDIKTRDDSFCLENKPLFNNHHHQYYITECFNITNLLYL